MFINIDAAMAKFLEIMMKLILRLHREVIDACLWDRFSLNIHPKLKATVIDTPVTRAKKRGMIHNSRNVAVEIFSSQH